MNNETKQCVACGAMVVNLDAPPFKGHFAGCSLAAAWRSSGDPMARIDALERMLEAICDEFESTVRHAENRGKGGQQAPFHGDFASAPPSTVRAIAMWARDIRAVLAGEVL